MKKINLKEKLSKLNEYWSPRVITEMNDYQFKIVKVKGDFIWHHHKDTDEAFIVIEGSMVIKFKNKSVKLNAGEIFVVPKGVEHKPYAKNECKILIIEPKGVINTGQNKNELTLDKEIWI